MTIREATSDDLSAVVALSARVRAGLEAIEPTFWRRHPQADEAQAAWFGLLLGDDSHHVLVRQGPASGPADGPVDGSDDREGAAPPIDGFVVARVMDAPPVYDPGGRTCLVDDLVWSDPDGADELVAAVRRWASSVGCTQLVVITPAADTERRDLLDRSGLHPTSEWWSGPI